MLGLNPWLDKTKSFTQVILIHILCLIQPIILKVYFISEKMAIKFVNKNCL